MNVFEAVFLGIIQGLTEFLPVSSSGHLVLFGSLLGINEPTIAFEVLLHFGTLIAIFIAFWSDVVGLWKGFIKLVSRPREIRQLINDDPQCRMIYLIVIATIPTVLVGLIFKDWITQLFNTPVFTGFMLLVTGTILFISDRISYEKKDMNQITFKDGLAIGLSQALAILPGISRSGTTIACGLLRGVKRENAARFSFLLSIPAILGSQILAFEELFLSQSATTPLWILLIGTAISAFTGYFAIRLLLQFVRRGRLIVFSYYTWFVGLLVIFMHFK